MSSSQELIKKRSKYYAFKENINSLAIQINKGMQELESPIIQTSENYKINDENGDKKKLESCQTKLREKYNLLMNQTMPAIDNKINRLNREIEEALQEEAKSASAL